MNEKTIQERIARKLEPVIELYGKEFVIKSIRAYKKSKGRNIYNLKLTALYETTKPEEREIFYLRYSGRIDLIPFPFSRLSSDELRKLWSNQSNDEEVSKNLEFIISDSQH